MNVRPATVAEQNAIRALLVEGALPVDDLEEADVRFIVADSAGLADTAHVDLFPEADLRPTLVSALPESVAAGDSLFVAFRLANDGRMLAHRSRWRLDLGGVLLAEGDTTVSAGDSISIALALGSLPVVSPGSRTLRLIADALGSASLYLEARLRARIATYPHNPH